MPRPGPAVRSGVEHVAVVVLGDRGMDEAQLAIVEQAAIRVLRRDDDEFLAVEGDVPLDQRQRSPCRSSRSRSSRSVPSKRACRGQAVDALVMAFMFVVPKF